jgi:TonB family protein
MGRLLLLLLVLSGLALAAPASAATTSRTPAPAAQITNPDWLRKPSPDDISRYYPKAAQQRGVGGRVRVRCGLANDGVLNDCVVLSEAPPGYGFGEAALNVASRFQMRPGTRDGRPIAGQIIVPILFSPEAPGRAASARQGAVLANLILLPFIWIAIGWALL